jgi:hypothetical protein
VDVGDADPTSDRTARRSAPLHRTSAVARCLVAGAHDGSEVAVVVVLMTPALTSACARVPVAPAARPAWTELVSEQFTV